MIDDQLSPATILPRAAPLRGPSAADNAGLVSARTQAPPLSFQRTADLSFLTTTLSKASTLALLDRYSLVCSDIAPCR